MNRSPFSFLLSTAAAAVTLTALVALPSHADGGQFDSTTGTFYEQNNFGLGKGDAGDVLSTADMLQYDNVSKIKGNLSGLADMYEIDLTGGTFTATAKATSGSLQPELFLFDASGHGVEMVYADGTSGTSTLTLTPPSAGIYYLAISSYNYQPTTNGTTDIFNPDPAVAGKSIPNGSQVGAASATAVLGTDPNSTWALGNPGGSHDGENNSGGYTIALGGVTAAPEPSLFVTGFAMLGTTGLGLVRGRRRMSRKGTVAAA